nr:MAG TPA: hypothetical protein [Caudoviricetes sp.]DAV37187.1 MAG TPA: hypothetical protein [Caudoviricetes sp.]
MVVTSRGALSPSPLMGIILLYQYERNNAI